jgi:hypothetical protein
MQKNGQNGEENFFILKHSDSASILAPCSVSFTGSYTSKVSHTPLAAYQSTAYDTSTKFITAPDIEGAMRRVDARVGRPLAVVVARGMVVEEGVASVSVSSRSWSQSWGSGGLYGVADSMY